MAHVTLVCYEVIVVAGDDGAALMIDSICQLCALCAELFRSRPGRASRSVSRLGCALNNCHFPMAWCRWGAERRALLPIGGF